MAARRFYSLPFGPRHSPTLSPGVPKPRAFLAASIGLGEADRHLRIRYLTRRSSEAALRAFLAFLIPVLCALYLVDKYQFDAHYTDVLWTQGSDLAQQYQ